MAELLRKLEHINKNDTLFAGGKGSSLGEMIRAGINVPPGFVVLANTFDKFLEETDPNVEIGSILHSVNYKEIHTVEKASEKIRSLILNSVVSKNVADKIFAFFDDLGAKYVAVRSSANAEDSPSAAWAGQLESYLNITREGLIENIKKCWASLFTPRAILYRFEKELQDKKISMAVVVQKMIQSEVAGVAFSVHPVTQDRNEVLIEAVLGFGETLVSGQITPDSYVIEKESRIIRNRHVQQKEQVLKNAEIIELTDLIIKIENHHGFPCDIEWARENGKFYVLQSRPITTLASNEKDYVSGLGNLVSLGKRETDKFFASLRIRGWTEFLEKEIQVSYKTMVINSEGEMFVNEEEDDRIRDALKNKRSNDALAYINKLYQLRDKLIQNIKTYSAEQLEPEISKMFAYLLIAKTIVEEVFEQSSEKDKKIFDRWRNDDPIFDVVQTFHTIPNEHTWTLVFNNGELTTLDYTFKPEENNREISERPTHKSNFWKKISNIILGFKKIKFEKITRDTTYIMQEMWTYGCSEAIEKAYGWKNPYTPSIINYMNNGSIEVWENAKATRWLANTILNKNTKNPEFMDGVLQKYKEILSKINNAQGDKLLQLQELKNLIETSREAIQYYVPYYYSSLDDRTPKKIYKRVVEMRNNDDFFAKNNIVIRDSLINLYPQLKGYETTIFYDELDSIPGIDVLRKRRDHFLTAQGEGRFGITLDEYNEMHPEFYFKKDKIKWSNSVIIKGEIAQKGKVTGKVKILRRRDQIGEVVEGDIIVSPMTTTDLLPAVIRSAAIITDEGGITSHAAITARELKKPCIIGTKIATQVLKDGDIVEVDADRGVIKIVSSR